MFILFSPGSDPMLLDSLQGMDAMHVLLSRFLSAPDAVFKAAAESSGSPAPYERFLSGLQIEKTEGPINLTVGGDGYLHLEGSRENLSRYISHFKFSADEEGEHHHPEYNWVDGKPLLGFIRQGSLSLIVQVDSEHVAELKSES